MDQCIDGVMVLSLCLSTGWTLSTAAVKSSCKTSSLFRGNHWTAWCDVEMLGCVAAADWSWLWLLCTDMKVHTLFFSSHLRLFVSEVPHLHNNSFVEKLLELKPRLSLLKAAELLKILQSSLRQSSLLLLTLPQQVLRAPSVCLSVCLHMY